MAGKKKQRASEPAGQQRDDAKSEGSIRPMVRIQQVGDHAYVIACGDHVYTGELSWTDAVKAFGKYR